jgi:hypothetical protein
LAAKGCTYQGMQIKNGQPHALGDVHVEEGSTGARPGDFRPWKCHNGRRYWSDTGEPMQPKK